VALFSIVLMNLGIAFMLIIMTILGIIIFPFSFVLWKVVTGWKAERIMRLFIWIYGKGWLGIVSPFIHFRRRGFRENVAGPPCIFVVNHLSFFDTFFMGALPFSDVIFAIRSWPFKMIWYAPFVRLAHYFDVERMGWDKTLKASKDVLAKGGSLLFFPEAHRSRDGELGRFFSGAFKVAIHTGVAIVPLCITGTDELFPPGRWWFKPAYVQLKALKPVDPSSFPGESGHMQMRKAVKRIMSESVREIKSQKRVDGSSIFSRKR